ncbi:hypothetical protein [Caldicellulosiruptor acetigenus]|uniref:SLH domain-containing protein n=1 Tax=Caldicellulosiruptor acetigenus 6A TaxID=632516 RepID=G2PYZ5_9FIRM|nr:hypothetical protein [Caldicellulosiruptor acetigenus]AEM73216.1 hypothetical protein Calla_0562 [Caldicellulosiruptor acetigenus 6A]
MVRARRNLVKTIIAMLITAGMLMAVCMPNITLANSTNAPKVTWEYIPDNTPVPLYIGANINMPYPYGERVPVIGKNYMGYKQWLRRNAYKGIEDAFRDLYGWVEVQPRMVDWDKYAKSSDISIDYIHDVIVYNSSYPTKSAISDAPIKYFIPTKAVSIANIVNSYNNVKAMKVIFKEDIDRVNRAAGGKDGESRGMMNFPYILNWDEVFKKNSTVKPQFAQRGIYSLSLAFFLVGGVNNRIVFNATRSQLGYIASKFYADVNPNDVYAPMVTIATVSQCLDGYKKVTIDPKTKKKVYSKENYFRPDAPIIRKELLEMLNQTVNHVNAEDLGGYVVLTIPGYSLETLLGYFAPSDLLTKVKTKFKIKDDLTAIRFILRYTPEYWDYDINLLYKPVSRFEFIVSLAYALGLQLIPVNDSLVKIKNIIPQYDDSIALKEPGSFYYITNLKTLPLSYRFKKVKFDDITKYLNSKYVWSGEIISNIPTRSGLLKKPFKTVSKAAGFPAAAQAYEVMVKKGIVDITMAKQYVDSVLAYWDFLRVLPGCPKYPDTKWWLSPITRKEALILMEVLTAYYTYYRWYFVPAVKDGKVEPTRERLFEFDKVLLKW